MQLSGPQLSHEDLQRVGGTIQYLQNALSAKIVGQKTLQQSLLIGLIAYARGDEHHRGDEIGSHGTKVVLVRTDDR